MAAAVLVVHQRQLLKHLLRGGVPTLQDSFALSSRTLAHALVNEGIWAIFKESRADQESEVPVPQPSSGVAIQKTAGVLHRE